MHIKLCYNVVYNFFNEKFKHLSRVYKRHRQTSDKDCCYCMCSICLVSLQCVYSIRNGGVTHSFKLHPVAFVDIGLADALVCFLYMVLFSAIAIPRIGLMTAVALYTRKPLKFGFVQAMTAVQMWRCGANHKVC